MRRALAAMAGEAGRPPREHTSAGFHGPLRAGSVGPKSATAGVPTAQARWSGPVSAATMARARWASAANSSSEAGKLAMAVPPDAATTRSASPSSPGPQLTSVGMPRRASREASSP
jgi:hypothetical protein